jgi:hypothetical protein
MARRKPKYQVSLLEAQRRRLEALGRWFEFVEGRRAITRENFSNELLFPTYRALGGHPYFGAGRSSELSEENIAEVRQLIVDGFKELAQGRTWFLSLRDLEISITLHGTGYKGTPLTLSQIGIAQLLRNEEWRIGRCSWCGKGFLKKKRGEYCGGKCSQHMRTKRIRDPQWKKDEAKARRLGLTVNEFRTAEEYPCPKCNAINLIPQKQPVVKCRKCGEIFVGEFAKLVVPTRLDGEVKNG